MHQKSVQEACALLLALALAGCATGPTAPPPRAASGPAHFDVGLAAQAAPFEAFTRKAAGIDPTFRSAADVAEGLRAGAAYEPRELEASMIAFGAMAALQEPTFAAAARDPASRDLARRLAANPDAVYALPGAQAAAARAGAALSRRGDALGSAGARVKAQAYAVQRQGAWSRAKIANAPARLAQAKRISAAGYRAADGDRAQVIAAVQQRGGRGGVSPATTRAVAYAALTALGQERQGASLLNSPAPGSCLRMAKLNFHQCLASAGTQYEDIYCLGAHALSEPGQCVTDAAKPRGSRRASAF